MSTLVCPYCSGEFFAPSEELLLSHVRLVHSCEPGFTIQCSLNGCSRTFSSFKSYQNHRRQKHANYSVDEVSQPTPEPSEDFSELCDGSDVYSEANITNLPPREEITSFAAKWILKTRETRKLTRSAMQGVVEDVTDLVTFVSNTMLIDNWEN